MKTTYAHFGRYFVCLTLLAVFGTAIFGQKVEGGNDSNKKTKILAESVFVPSASVDPVIFDNSNSDCEDLDFLHMNGVGDVRFSHIITNWELKLDFTNPNGTFPFTTGGGRVVTGPQDATRSVTVTSSSSPSTVSSWSANLPITAVIVKVGTTTYAYPYKPFKFFDTLLATGDPLPIRYVSFCFAEPTGPTAGEISITGRVVDSNGHGLARAQMVLFNGVTGESKAATTSSFGYYTFDGLDANNLYVLSVSHKRFSFSENQRAVTPNGSNVSNVNFVALPAQ